MPCPRVAQPGRATVHQAGTAISWDLGRARYRCPEPITTHLASGRVFRDVGHHMMVGRAGLLPEFLRGLRLAHGIADRKSTMPMLANVLLRSQGKPPLLVAA